MSVAADILKALKDIITLNERIAQLERDTDKQDSLLLDLRDRIVRIEVFLELLQQSAPRRRTRALRPQPQ